MRIERPTLIGNGRVHASRGVWAALATLSLLAAGGAPGRAQDLYVTSMGDLSIKKVTLAGGVTDFAHGLKSPRAVAFGPDGIAYFADTDLGSVFKVTPAGPKEFVGGLRGPTGLAFDDSGNLFVTNYTDGTVGKVTPQGVVTTVAGGLSACRSIVVGGDGSLYITNYNDETVKKVAPDGQMTTFAHIPSPTCIARDEAGNLYVTSYKEGTVSKITPDAKVTVFARGLRTPFGVALDADNSVYVSAEYEGAIYRIMPGGGVTQKVVGGLNDLRFLAFGPLKRKSPVSTTPTAAATPTHAVDANEVKPHAGEIALTGAVSEVHPDQRTLTMSATVVTTPDGVTSRLPRARAKTIVTTPLTLLGTAGAPRKDFADLRVGTTLTVVGQDSGVGKPLTARVIVFP